MESQKIKGIENQLKKTGQPSSKKSKIKTHGEMQGGNILFIFINPTIKYLYFNKYA